MKDTALYRELLELSKKKTVYFMAEELNAKETYWITSLETNINGYNCNTGGDQATIVEYFIKPNITGGCNILPIIFFANTNEFCDRGKSVHR